MKIESLTMNGFRCFDQGGQTIHLDNLTCFVGPNASGKTAAMMALARLFGESTGQRQVVPSDFHLSSGESLKDKPSRALSIECRLAFPELEEDRVTASTAVPETFNQMIVGEIGGTPYCRVRLEATWTDDGTAEGDVEQSIWWILTDSDDPVTMKDENRCRVQAGDRGKVRVVYVPAARDPKQLMRTTTATTFGRLLDALDWNGAEESLKNKLVDIQEELGEVLGIQTMNSEIQKSWRGFYDGRVARSLSFQILEETPAALIRHLIPVFNPGEDGQTMGADDLSDGLRSLFALSLSLGLFRIEELLRTDAETKGFSPELAEKLPVLTLFAVEEPENHLSPHYLGRIVSELMKTGAGDSAQVIITSHSPSILGRIEPDDVRYFLGHEQSRSTRVMSIPLPTDKSDESFKYVREAVRGFPELYFARLVILGEGPSEEIVLKKLFEVSGSPLDTHFISVVPLGGKHVNHFWRLLHGLDIPFLTLLDLDREKEGAGWGRIQYVRDQLVAQFGMGHERLRYTNAKGKTVNLEDETWKKVSDRPSNEIDNLEKCLRMFAEHFDIFFSSPLDLDFAMLEAFTKAYVSLAPARRGPRLPEKEDPEYQVAINRRMKQVLSADADKAPDSLGETYSPEQQKLFAWYKYLFIDGSKPVTHMQALVKIKEHELREKMPAALKNLVARARVLVAQNNGDG
ncbi:MAG: AAA family ATPase [Candidatus Hydrogenedentes bacterium]|nr:AAA family ATPase [Candidatus Hydrogenedentota bacterium]